MATPSLLQPRGGPSRFRNGISTDKSKGPLGLYPYLDPFTMWRYETDFPPYLAADWTLASVGGGTAALSVASFDYGALLLTNGAAGGNNTFLQLLANLRTQATTGVAVNLGKKIFFKVRLAPSDATNCIIVAGCFPTNATPVATPPTDGFYFSKAAATTAITFNVVKASVVTSITLPGVMGIVMTELAFLYDPRQSTVNVWQDGVGSTGAVVTNVPPQTAALRASFGMQNANAVANTMSVDYFMVANER